MSKKLILAIFISAFWLTLPKFVSAATLNLSPSSGNYGVGSNITVNVLVNTQSAAVNTAEARISYSTQTLELVSVRQGSTFYLISPGSPGRDLGTAYFSGGLPTPGYNGNSGNLGVMTFRAKAEGTATVSIDSGQILLNDGLGTNAFSGSSNARFSIKPPAAGAVKVSSLTHPSPEEWYAKSAVDLSWDRPSGAFGYSFVLDQDPETIPDSTLDTTVTTFKSYQDLRDGKWFFHIKARAQDPASGFGQTTHFRIQIDTEKPLLFDIKLEGESDVNDVSRTPAIKFEADDPTSGIDHYDIYVDSVSVKSGATSPYNFAKLENGPHQIRVVAFDKAGNDRKSEIAVIVQGPQVVGFFQRNLSLPIYMIMLINFFQFILIGMLLYLVLRRKKKNSDPSDEIEKLRTDVERTMEELKLDISHQLVGITATSFDKLLRKEGVEAKAMAKKMTAAKKKIDKEINDFGKRGEAER